MAGLFRRPPYIAVHHRRGPAPQTPATQAVVLGLISQTATISDPTVLRGTVTVSVGLIDQTAAIHNPTITTANAISVGLIDQTASATAPTITTGAVAASVGLINQTAATFTPTVTPGAVSALLGLIDQTATIAAASVGRNIDVGLISQTATISAATVSNLNTISVALINQTASASSPTITTGAVNVDVGLITQTAATFAPTVTPGVATISVGLINQTAVISAATVSNLNTIAVGLINQTATSSAPTITTGAVSASVGLINQTAQISTPTITTGAVSVSPNLITQTATTSAPTISATNTISVGLITQTATAAAPSISIDVPLSLINQTAVASAPTVAVGQTEITLGLINQTATIAVPAVYIRYGSAVIVDSPLAWWRLGEPSGVIANDELGNADADVVNTPTLGASGLLTGDADTAYTFSRASLEYAVADGDVPAGSSAGASIEGWARFATLTSGTRYPVARWFHNTPEAEARLYYDVTEDCLRYSFYDPTLRDIRSDAWTPSTGVTYHLVVAHDYVAETVSFYVNGVLLSSEDVSAFATPIPLAANGFASIARAGSDYFDGTLDEVALYAHVLSGARVLVHYNVGSGGAQDVSLGLIDQTATISTPTISTANSIVLGLINQTATASAPTISVGAAPVSVGLIDQTAQPRTPTVSATNAISVGLVNQTATIAAPTITTANTVSVGLINQTATATAPSVQRGAVNIDLGLISQPAATFTPSVTATASISIGRIDQTAVIFEMTLATTGAQDIELGLINQTAVAHAPVVELPSARRRVGGGGVWMEPRILEQERDPHWMTPWPQFVGFQTIAVNAEAFSPDVALSDDEVIFGLTDEDLLVLA